MRVPVRNMSGESVGELVLREDVFGIEPNIAVMHQAVVRQQANARLGTHGTKSRSEISGGGAKPWRQKGTGRARQGSTRAPQWVGGAVAFGPDGRRYKQRMNRKMRRLALRSALSAKATEGRVVVLEDLSLETPKTKEMVGVLDRLETQGSVLIILDEHDANVELAARNLGEVKTILASALSVRDLLKYDYVLMGSEVVSMLEDWLGVAA